MKPAREAKTALVLIDVQNGFLHPTHWGTRRSTPQCESNIGLLLAAARRDHDHQEASEHEKVLVCHVHHHSTAPDSALRPDRTIEVEVVADDDADADAGATTPPRRRRRVLVAVDAQPFAAPAPGESVWVKHVNSAFVGTGLEAFLRGHGVRQVVLCGLTTDHCVSTSARMAANLGIVEGAGEGGGGGGGEIVVVRDACATYAKGGFDAETVHAVSLASLDGEFATVADTKEVVAKILGGV